MRAGPTIAALAACAMGGTALRALPASPERPAWVLAGPGAPLATNVGDVQGRLVSVPGCAVPVGVATIPGYLSGLDYTLIDWARGPAVRRFWFGAQPLAPDRARLAAVTARALSLAGRAFGLPAPLPPYAVVTFEPAVCARTQPLDGLAAIVAGGS